jgi:hypothetical protein
MAATERVHLARLSSCFRFFLFTRQSVLIRHHFRFFLQSEIKYLADFDLQGHWQEGMGYCALVQGTFYLFI